MSTRRQNFLFTILGLCGLAATLTAAQRMGGRGADDYKFFDELVEVKHIISSRFVDEPSDKVLKEGAIQGMVEALNDPYTVYVPSSDKREFNKDLTGEYVGIGAQVNMQEGWLTIVSPLEDSPAFRSGLMADDRVVAINDTSTQGKLVEDCVTLLMGEPGTSVKLSVERKGEKLDLTVLRERIKTRSVKGFHRSAKDASNWDYTIDPVRGIAYVRLTQFTPQCSNEVLAALKSAGVDRGALKGLVLDLRFNPGGLLQEAEQIADLFLDSGIIVSTRGRAYAEKVTRATSEGTLPNFPMVVLVNGSSASASEVLSGALVENNRAIVVGTRSYGKGSVQSVIELPSGNGSELKITEQGYYLPSGRSITRKDNSSDWGVDPTQGYYIPMTDAQTSAMLEVRRKEEVLRFAQERAATPSAAPAAQSTSPAGPAPSGVASAAIAADTKDLVAVDWSNPDSILAALKDPQLAAAVKAVQIKIDLGAWQPTGEQGKQNAKIASSELVKLNLFQQRLLRELARTEKRIDAVERAAGDEAKPPADLWENTIDLVGGVVEVKDKSGRVIATLDITGNNLERLLIEADVKKRDEIVK